MPLVQALWRHRWLAVGTAWLVCTAGWIGAAFVPTKYESSARVYLNADPLLTPLLKGLAADTDPSRHLDFMQRTLLSRPNLEQLIRLTDLDTGIRTPGEKEALFKGLSSDIEVKPITLNLLTLSYRDSDPVLAKNIVQSLLTIFAEKMAGSSRAEMDSAQRFLEGEIASYRDQLRAAEKRRGGLGGKKPGIRSTPLPGRAGGRRWGQSARTSSCDSGPTETRTCRRCQQARHDSKRTCLGASDTDRRSGAPGDRNRQPPDAGRGTASGSHVTVV